MHIFTRQIAKTLSLSERNVDNTLRLLDEKCTIPFISRYRKECTGNLDEIAITHIAQLKDRMEEMVKRKETILTTIEKLGKLTDALRVRINECWDMAVLEDIYMPYKPKRRTKAEVARQHGLEPLAQSLLLQRGNFTVSEADKYVRGDVKTCEDAIAGAKCIIAELINEDERVRRNIRNVFRREAVISSKVVRAKSDDNGARKFSDYFDFSEPLRRCSSHRLLALRRGESEGYLRVSISVDEDTCRELIRKQYVKGRGMAGDIVAEAADDAFKRLLKPSIENEFALHSKQAADKEAINVFATNLRQLLLAAPLGQKRVMGIDPGFRTGCKVVCLNAQGMLLHNETIYPHPPKSDVGGASKQVLNLISKYKIEAIAVGNGTASRETTAFLRSLELDSSVRVFVVSEDGASVYSASEVAREEFPDKDVTVRGAVSIARRLMDPLAELVKINPQSIGVGQYQHDVDQRMLRDSLDTVVMSCVNSVGVDLNTASRHLLMYVSGLNAATASNIVDYRNIHGPFRSRAELKKVSRLGPVAFVQCAGFLRIPGAENPLDNTAVHPESYDIVRHMAKDCGCSVSELIADKGLQKKLDLSKYVSDSVGMPTLNDILVELQRPGRDPRSEIEVFEFDESVHSVDDLRNGMVLPGIVTNITKFGVFVDIGVHQDGLVHISQLSNRYVADPTQVVVLHQHVNVKVIEVDIKRNRISLSMKNV